MSPSPIPYFSIFSTILVKKGGDLLILEARSGSNVTDTGSSSDESSSTPRPKGWAAILGSSVFMVVFVGIWYDHHLSQDRAAQLLAHFNLRSCLGSALGHSAFCLECFTGTDVVRVLPCKHIFHRHCFDGWFCRTELQDKCPLCRTDFLGSATRPQRPAPALMVPARYERAI